MPSSVDTSREDPLLGFHFALEVSGVIKGYFTHVSGLSSENELVETKVVSDKGIQTVLLQPGRLKWNPVTLKRGVTSTLDIWDWRQQVVDGKVKDARKAASIIAFDQSLVPVARWDMVQAWPSKVSGPEFDSTTGNVMFEEVTIVFESVKRVKP
jgi:phage tail-like protein